MKFIKIFIILALLLSVCTVLATQKVLVKVEIPMQYLVVNPGDVMQADICLFKINGDEREDHLIDLYLMDDEGNILMEKEKTLALEYHINTNVHFNLPSDLPPGNYQIQADINGADKENAWFIVEQKYKEPFNTNLLCVLIFVMMIAFILVIIYHRRLLRMLHIYQKL